MRIGGASYAIDWGHFAFLTIMAAVTVWYLGDVRSVSLNVNNTLFVQPTALFALLIYLLIVPQCFRRHEPTNQPILEEEAAVVDAEAPGEMWRIVGITAALGLYALTFSYIGFDIATWLFTLAGMWICGERRPLVLAAFPFILAIALVSAFKVLMPYPMFNLFL